MSKRLFTIALLVVTIASAGVLIWDFVLDTDHDAVLGATAFTVAMTTFFGIMMLGDSLGGKWSLTKGGMRTAIAGSVVVTYLFLVSFYSFVVYGGELPAIAKSLLDSFTGIVGITIAFYFGAEAVLQALGKEETSERESTAKKGNEK